jgi:hypothetical protein
MVYFKDKPVNIYKFGRVVISDNHKTKAIKKVAQDPSTGLYWWRIVGYLYENSGRVFVYSNRLKRITIEICLDFERIGVDDCKYFV